MTGTELKQYRESLSLTQEAFGVLINKCQQAVNYQEQLPTISRWIAAAVEQLKEDREALAYAATLKRRPLKTNKCGHPEKPHYGKERCRNCYYAYRKELQIEKQKKAAYRAASLTRGWSVKNRELGGV